MTVSVFDRLAGLPVVRVVFAEVGTSLPRTVDEELDPAFRPLLVEDVPDEAVRFGADGPVRSGAARRFKTMSMVLDVGAGEERARLVLPALRVEQAADGLSVRFMFSAGLLDRWREQDEGRPATVSVQRRAPYVREAAIAAKREQFVAEGQPASAVAAFDAVTAELRGQERQMVAGMTQWASMVVSSWVREHHAELSVLPSAIRERLLIEATVAYLYGYGLVEPVEPDEEAGLHPLEFGEAVPAHLHPDVAWASAAFARMRMPGR